MYSLTVSHHFMVAHSLVGAVFGPAQQLHGATLWSRPSCAARRSTPTASSATSAAPSTALKAVLGEFDYRNLDDLPEFRGRNTTTEFLAGEIHRRLARRIGDGALGPDATAAMHSLRVVVRENPVAWAGYDAALG